MSWSLQARRNFNQTLPVVLVALSLSACVGLRQLPNSQWPLARVRSAGDLWQVIDGVPRQERRESGTRSTLRVAIGDLARKRADQNPALACKGTPPPGFTELKVDEFPSERAPLRALFHPPPNGNSPVIIVVHGLFDSKYSKYVAVTAQALANQGFGVLSPDMRWHGCLYNEKMMPTLGFEEGRDLVAWALYLKTRFPESPIGLIGFSLGSLDVISAMAEDKEGTIFRAGGIVVSPPAALERSADRLDQYAYFSDLGFGTLVRHFFQDTLSKRIQDLGIRDNGNRPFNALLEWFAQRESRPKREILAKAEPTTKITKIKRPLLLLVSTNDPVFPDSAITALQTAAKNNPWIHVTETSHGGHIGVMGLYPEWFSRVLGTFFPLSSQIPNEYDGPR